MPRLLRLGALFLLASPAMARPPSLDALSAALLAIPIGDRQASASVDLPVGDGRVSRFLVRDSRTVPPRLAKRFPGLRSYRGSDDEGRTVRLDLASGGVRLAVRHDAAEWAARAATPAEWTALADPAASVAERGRSHPPILSGPGTSRSIGARAAGSAPGAGRTGRSGGAVRYDFRLAVAVGSRLAARWGGTVEGALAEVVHRVNRANEMFETDVGVHFTLVDGSDRLMLSGTRRDPFLRTDPAPATVALIDRVIGPTRYDIGHAFLDGAGGESAVGTTCSDAHDDDVLATHKAAAWTGAEAAAASSGMLDTFIHLLGRQLGAWPTANGCRRETLDDRAFEPGAGSTAMSYAFAACRRDRALQSHTDRYFHGASIEQMHDWLAGAGGRCAKRTVQRAAAPWIDPRSLDRRILVPARTPFALEAAAVTGEPGRRLTYTWEQMDAGDAERGPLVDDGHGPLFRSFPPSPSPRRELPRLSTSAGETLPTTSRDLTFRLTVRDNGGDEATTASADVRVQVVNTGRPFALMDDAGRAVPGHPLRIRWDVAGTDAPPLSCHFVHIDLSFDGGESWRTLAVDEPNDGDAAPVWPADARGDHARLRVRCDNRPFFAISRDDFAVTDTGSD